MKIEIYSEPAVRSHVRGDTPFDQHHWTTQELRTRIFSPMFHTEIISKADETRSSSNVAPSMSI